MPVSCARDRAGARARALAEMLVLIAIVVVLVGILLPAAVKIREAANRAACRNNLKQIALAALAYHDAHGHFPVNTQQPDDGGLNWTAQSRHRSWSWLARSLPYLRQSELPGAGAWVEGPFGEHTEILATPVKTFFCPSDTAADDRTSTNRADLEGVTVALTNYKGVSGANWCWGDWANDGPTGNCNGLAEGDGIFFRHDWRSPRRLADVTDGVSNTFLVGEDVPARNTHCSWPYANNAVGTCAIGPNARRRDGSEYDPADWVNVYSFRSRHRNGLHFALADGSARFVGNRIPLPLYRALSTMNGKEAMAFRDY